MTERALAWSNLGEFPIALGCMALSGIYGRVDRSDAIRTVRHAASCGFDHFDTAELYGPCENEILVSEALAGLSHVTVATKVGYRIGGTSLQLDSTPASLRNAVEGSLGRLRRDTIDLVYQHRQDPSVPVEESVGALSDLVGEGKIRWIGLSKVDAPTLTRAHAVHPVAAVQNEISLLAGPPPSDLVRAARAAGTTILSFSPLARGLLAEKRSRPVAGDYRSTLPHFGAAFAPALDRLWGRLDRVAKRIGVSRTAVSLAWVRQHSAVPVIGPKNVSQVDEACSGIVLSPADIEELSELFDPLGVQSGRAEVRRPVCGQPTPDSGSTKRIGDKPHSSY